jgi:hypothetical protein
MREALATIVAVIAVAVAACYDAGAPCGDGYCDDGTVCTPAGDRCVYPQQLVDCLARPDGEACIVPGGREGVCAARVCRQVVCGDGVVEGSEQCDGANHDGATDCSALGAGYHPAGTLSCSSQCRFDPATCGGRCGDGVVQPGFEACDGSVGDRTCETQGFRGGILACDDDCQLDVGACIGECGDGAVTGGELCDGTNFGGQSCTSRGFYGGELRCTDGCSTVDTSACVGRCGDGVKNGPEICDGPDLGGLSCPTYGWYQGVLACGPDCVSIDRDACVGYCGDGIRNGTEQCDGVDHVDISCTSVGAIAGALGCNAYCQPTTDGCHWGGLRPVPRPPRDQTIRALGVRSRHDIWAATDTDILHFDGVRWTTVDIGLQGLPTDFWAGTQGQLFAHTLNGELAYHDGQSWTIAHRDLRFAAVAATTPDNVWVHDDDSGVRHFDGSSWRNIPPPPPEQPIGSMLPFDDGTTWFLGVDAILRYDGVGWTEFDLVGDSPDCIWGNASDDVYAMTRAFLEAPVLRHYDGHGWREVDPPFGIEQPQCGWSNGEHRTWHFGTLGAQPVVVRVDDGVPWLIPLRALDLGYTWTYGADLWSYDGVDLWRLDGIPWTPRAVPTAGRLDDIWPASPGSAWVKGYAGTSDHVCAVTPDGALGPFDFHGVGDVNAIAGTETGVWIGGSFGVRRYTGAGSFESLPYPGRVEALWARSETDIWAVAWHDLVHFDGTGWETARPVPNSTFRFAGTGPSNLWLESGDALLRYDGVDWNDVQLIESRVGAFATSGPDDHWVFSGDHSYQHDGESATALRGSWDDPITSAWAESPRSVWAFGWTRLHHFDGVVWSRVALPAHVVPSSMAGGWGAVWVGGERGMLYNLPTALAALDGGACSPVLRAYCNVSLRGHTAETEDGPVDCHDGVAHRGGELHYKIEVPVTGRLTATVTSRAAVDVAAVRPNEHGGCDAASCVPGQPSDAEIVLDVQQGQTYYLVVGARDGAAPFTLDVRCEKQ